MLSSLNTSIKYVNGWFKHQKRVSTWDTSSTLEYVIKNNLISFENDGNPTSLIVTGLSALQWQYQTIGTVFRARELGSKCVVHLPTSIFEKYSIDPIVLLKILCITYEEQNSNNSAIRVDVSARNKLIDYLFNSKFNWKLQLDSNFVQLLQEKNTEALHLLDRIQDSIANTSYPLLSINPEYSVTSFDLNVPVPSYVVQHSKVVPIYTANVNTPKDWDIPVNELLEALVYTYSNLLYRSENKLNVYYTGSPVLAQSFKDSYRLLYKSNNIISGTENVLYKYSNPYKLDVNNLLESITKGFTEGYTAFYVDGSIF